MGSVLRSRSRGRVDRAQRCRMLRRFLVHFTAEALEAWKLVAAGEDAFSTNHEQEAETEMGREAEATGVAAASTSKRQKTTETDDLTNLSRRMADPSPPEPPSTKGSQPYKPNSLLGAKKDISREYRRPQAAEKASVEAEDRVKADKDALRDAQHAFDLAKASIRAVEGREQRFDELGLDRRVAKELRNKAYKT
ncbi:hypothetical protein Ct61P_15513 [Colletotrichum tofieldiae]|nr:hypothetical protein Ct61P_15513 [Colletotrichum tofieldiae]